jgi:hypothetical protein
MKKHDFNFLFYLHQVSDGDSYPGVMDTFIIEWVKPYLRDGDVLSVITGGMVLSPELI